MHPLTLNFLNCKKLWHQLADRFDTCHHCLSHQIHLVLRFSERFGTPEFIVQLPLNYVQKTVLLAV